jgi:hypothetical protein
MPKTLCREMVQENVDDDIVTNQYFPSQGPHERKKRIKNWFEPIATDMIAVGANSSLKKRASKPNKITVAS